MSGVTALQYLEECDLSDDFPELISMDWNMPLGNGSDFLEEYAKKFHQKYPQTKVLIISGVTPEMQLDQIMKYGFVLGFLPKPVNEQILSKTIL